MSESAKIFEPHFVRLDEDQAAGKGKVVVYWMNHAGGGLTMLTRVARRIASPLPIEFYSAPMPARESLSDQSFNGDLDAVARSLATDIVKSREASQDERPFVIIGHSFGSILAYRTAAELIQRGHAAHRLVVLSFPAADRLTREESLEQLSDRELIVKVDTLFGGVPEAMLSDPDAQKLFVPALRSDLGLLESYQHDAGSEQLPIPIIAICGTDDRAVDLAQMQRWKAMSSDEFRLRAMPGDHFFPLARMTDVLQAAAWEWLDG